MGVLVGWDDESRTCIRFDLEGHWTYDELDRAVLECIQLAKSTDDRINVIMDLSRSGPLPLGVIPRSRKLLLTLQPHLRIFMVANGDAFVSLMVAVFQKVYPQLGAVIRISPSLEKARYMLRRSQSESAAH